MKLKKTLTGLVLGGALALGINPAKGETIGMWNFNEGSGYVAYDSSGLHNNGDLSGVFWSQDTPSGGGYSTEFRREWNPTIGVAHNSSLNLNDEFTFEAQIKMSEQWYQPIIAKWSGGDPNAQHHPYLFGVRPTPNGQELKTYVKIEGEDEQGVGREFWLLAIEH